MTGAGNKRFIVDSYVPGERIVSRKNSMLGELKLPAAREEINEFLRKYPSDGVSRVADVPSAHPNPVLEAQIGRRLSGKLVLEVPVQRVPVPRELLDCAAEKQIQIIDVTGHRYR